MFEFRYTLQDDEFIRYNQHHALTSPEGKKAYQLFRAIIPLFCLIIFVLMIAFQVESFLVLVITIELIVMSGIWLIFSKRLYLGSMSRRIKKLRKQGRLPLNREVTLTFTENEITEHSDVSDNRTSYLLVERIEQSDSALYLYLNLAQAFVLPYRIFKDEAEKENLLAFVRSKATNLKSV